MTARLPLNPPAAPALHHDAGEVAFLAQLGDRVRAWRNQHGMTRKALALASGVSERYLAQLEAGQGNMSVLLLRKVARAMHVTIEALVREEASERAAKRHVALVGLRGAGKSTLGEKLAEALDARFVELDREVEREAGCKLGEVFSIYGQDAFRRFERRALERVLRDEVPTVIATGGSLVTDPETYELLLDQCRVVWLRARPEEHMQRVIAQGDMRPFSAQMRGKAASTKSGSPVPNTALDEIRRLLADREPLYSRADAIVETTGKSPRAALDELRSKVKP